VIDESSPVVVCFVDNLYFSSRILSTINRLDYVCKLIESADQIAPLDNERPYYKLTEPLEGVAGELIEKISRWQPTLIIFDLNNSNVPWNEWIRSLKSSSATRRIPIICFGSHKDKKGMQVASRVGADGVFSRNRFFNDLQSLIRKYARSINNDQFISTCHEPLSELAVKGLEEFNNGNYYEAHEYLEDAWNEDQSSGSQLYRAILQVAVAYLHIEQGNYRGAMKMFLRVRQWIDPLPPFCRGVNVEELRHTAYTAQDELSKLGPNQINDRSYAGRGV
jgi:predicted metal-dependent hydrolase/CheY-like chemotaxis protein